MGKLDKDDDGDDDGEGDDDRDDDGGDDGDDDGGIRGVICGAPLSFAGSNLQWAPVSALATDIQYHHHDHRNHHDLNHGQHYDDDLLGRFSAPNQILQANWKPAKYGVNLPGVDSIQMSATTHIYICHQPQIAEVWE